MLVKIIISDGSKQGVFIRAGASVKAACSFQPNRLDSNGVVVPWIGTKILSAEEIDISIVVQTKNQKSFTRLWEDMENLGYEVKKAVGAFCLEIKGRGEVIEDLASNLRLYNTDASHSSHYILNSNYPRVRVNREH
jgi:hypothetical protein